MTTYADIESATMQPTRHAYQFLAAEWSQRGKQFLGAALLLHHHVGNTNVVAHLIGQATELLGKSFLLWIDTDIRNSDLQRIGHDLIKLNDEVYEHLDHRLIDKEALRTLEDLHALFKRHALRYPDLLEFIFTPPEIPDCEPLLKHLHRLLRFADRLQIWQFKY
ncbi:MAG: HEPN domain-containing protein [Burkholderiales bacterium]|nr:HEPN domain-containing protein [Burkholderiales bacterium]